MQALSDGWIRVFTFKQGLLSRVAHDLRLRLERFEVRIDGVGVEAVFWPDSLRVDGAMKDGRLDESALSGSDKAEIQDNIQKKILHTAEHPQARFSGTAEPEDAGHRVRGELELVGTRVPLELRVTRRDGTFLGEVELVPSRWGIAPFKALMGAIKLQDRVLVRFELPEPS